jgi:hypothetical protein
MVSHRIRLYYSAGGVDTGSETGFHSWLQDWDDGLNSDTDDEVVNSIPETPTEPANPEKSQFYRAELTYAISEDPVVVLEEPYYALIDFCEWSRVGYHACDHGEVNPAPCAFTDDHVLEDGAVPDHVPTLL